MSKKAFAVVAALLFIFSVNCSAVVIWYEVVNVGGDNWVYHYTIENDSSWDIEAFSIEFDMSMFTDLALSSTPQIQTDWDEAFFDIAPGFRIYDALAIQNNIIAVGQTVSGFGVAFKYIGQETPSSQYFEIFDPDDYTTPLTTGTTVLIPEPATLLFTIGGLLILRKRRK